MLNTFDERIVVERASVDEAFLDLTELIDRKILEIGAAQLLQDVSHRGFCEGHEIIRWSLNK